MTLLKPVPRMSLLLALVCALVWCQAAAAADKKKADPVEPDFTKGENPTGETPTPWALGSTGAFGNMWRGKQTMIQIVRIDEGSPAAGKLAPLDVIVGVASPDVKSDPRFTWEARKALSEAITLAEKDHGKLVLHVWRPETTEVPPPKGSKKGTPAVRSVKQPLSAKVIQVTLTLPVKGAFSATAPWECKKTEALIADATKALVKDGLKGGIPDDLNALGLLATGDKTLIPIVRDYCHKIAKDSEDLDIVGEKGISAWYGGYRNVLLTEYYLLTKDEVVLPGIKALSHYLAYGQSGVGTWSHGMSDVKLHGLYGPSAVYGAINQVSIVCAISLALAQKCTPSKVLEDAINRSKMFYGWYVDKGTIPYGEHGPTIKHDNNGKNSMAAVFFNLIGDQEATRYYTRMTLASYPIRESGHTGHYFAWQWGAPGAATGGPAAAQAFVEATRWFTELERRADGRSFYQYQLETDTRKTNNWETTGQRLVQHCLPRKVLYITGKTTCLEPLTPAEVKESLDAATFNAAGLPVKDLLAALGNWSLVVRAEAAEELGKRDDDLVDQLITMLDSPNRYARYGACTALLYCGGRSSQKVVDALVTKVESDKDWTLRYYAANALFDRGNKIAKAPLGRAGAQATPRLLKVAALYDQVNDPMRMLSGQLSGMFFYSGRVGDYSGFYAHGKGIETLDRALLIPAIKAWLANPNGGVRSSVSIIFSKLSDDDLDHLYADIYYATKYQAAAGNMFGNEGRSNGAQLLAEKHFEEGIPLSLDYLYQEGWGQFQLVPGALEALANYGSAMKPYTQEILTKKPAVTTRFKKEWETFLKSIEKPVQLRSLKPYLEKSGIKEPVKVMPPSK